MAISRTKLAINNASLPPLSVSAQRAVLQAGLDSAPRTPRVFMGDEDSADYNLVQVIYAENVMPSAHGVRSVGFTPVTAAGPAADFDTIFPLRDSEENAVYYSPAHGNNYVYDLSTDTWTGTAYADVWAPDVLHADSNPANSKVTYAYVDGKTFVCFSRLKSDAGTPVDMSIMQWDSATQSLVPGTTIIQNLPFAAGTIDGISSSNGYLLVWSGLEIAWAFFNGADFNYEIYSDGAFTGSGNQIPEDIQGPITAILGISGGFVAFSARNCISANYHSQTIQSPWVFKEVTDAGGLESYEQATVEGSLGKLMAYTSAGLQTITLNSAEHAHPAIADFISRREVEIYDFSDHTLTRTQLSTDARVKLAAVGNRYIVISYGFFAGVFSYALIYDIALARWGKIRLRHRDCFAYLYSASSSNPVTYAELLDVTYEALSDVAYGELEGTPDVITPAPRALAFLEDDGVVQLASWAARPVEPLDASVVIVGRVQLTRSKNIQLNRVEVEGLKSGAVYIQASINGRTIDRVEETVVVEQTDDYHCAGCMVDCKNFGIVIEGMFDLSTIICEAMSSGEF